MKKIILRESISGNAGDEVISTNIAGESLYFPKGGTIKKIIISGFITYNTSHKTYPIELNLSLGGLCVQVSENYTPIANVDNSIISLINNVNNELNLDLEIDHNRYIEIMQFQGKIAAASENFYGYITLIFEVSEP